MLTRGNTAQHTKKENSWTSKHTFIRYQVQSPTSNSTWIIKIVHIFHKYLKNVYSIPGALL